MKTTRLTTLALFTSLLGAACAGQHSDVLCDPAPQFDIELFIDNLQGGLTDVSGYQLAVNEGGNLYHASAEGFSIYGTDPGGAVPMTEDTRMNVASVSKLVGTIALMQVLEKHGIAIDQPVHTYLPDRWKTQTHPDHFDAGSPYLVRFENLLRMETGIAFAGNNWSPGIMPTTAEMLAALSLPADPARVGAYQNGNFTLIRVLIAEIEYGVDETAADYNEQTTARYFAFIKENTFDELLLTPPMSTDAVNNYYAGDFTRAHQFPFDETFQDGDGYAGWGATSDPLFNGGSGGLVLSSMDLATVAAYFKHDDDERIASQSIRAQILENELGLTESSTGEHGRYQSKGGTRGPQSGTNRALRSRVMFFPNGVEAVVLTNSNLSGLGTLIRSSFDDAWVNPC